MLFASCLLLRVPTSRCHLGFRLCPFGLRWARRPQNSRAVVFRGKPLPLVLCANCPFGPTCLLPLALPRSRCSPGPPPLPHLQALLSYPSLCQPPDWAGVTQGGPGPAPSTPYSPFWGLTAHPSLCGRAAWARMLPPPRPPC